MQRHITGLKSYICMLICPNARQVERKSNPNLYQTFREK